MYTTHILRHTTVRFRQSDYGQLAVTMESQVQEVLAICPNVSVEVIKKDLLITDSVSSTVNRILDGVVEVSFGLRCRVAVPLTI